MALRQITWKRRTAETISDMMDRIARLPGKRFYDLHLEASARRHRRMVDIADVAARGHTIRFRTPSAKALWRAETLLSKEPATIEWIDRFDREDIFWDVGANIGLYALYAGLVRGVRTLAFEPAAFNYALLCDNIQLNGLNDRVAAYGIAFADERRLGSLKFSDDQPGAAFASVEAAGNAKDVLEHAILVFSLDDFIDSFSPPFPNHLKIDVDGPEEAILAGAPKTLSDPRLKTLSIEVDEDGQQRASRFDAILGAHGFRFSGAYGSPLAPTSPARNRHYFRE